MNRSVERILCTSLLSIGIYVALDSQGVTLSTQGIIGVALAAAGLAYLLMPEEAE